MPQENEFLPFKEIGAKFSEFENHLNNIKKRFPEITQKNPPDKDAAEQFNAVEYSFKKITTMTIMAIGEYNKKVQTKGKEGFGALWKGRVAVDAGFLYGEKSKLTKHSPRLYLSNIGTPVSTILESAKEQYDKGKTPQEKVRAFKTSLIEQFSKGCSQGLKEKIKIFINNASLRDLFNEDFLLDFQVHTIFLETAKEKRSSKGKTPQEKDRDFRTSLIEQFSNGCTSDKLKREINGFFRKTPIEELENKDMFKKFKKFIKSNSFITHPAVLEVVEKLGALLEGLPDTYEDGLEGKKGLSSELLPGLTPQFLPSVNLLGKVGLTNTSKSNNFSYHLEFGSIINKDFDVPSIYDQMLPNLKSLLPERLNTEKKRFFAKCTDKKYLAEKMQEYIALNSKKLDEIKILPIVDSPSLDHISQIEKQINKLYDYHFVYLFPEGDLKESVVQTNLHYIEKFDATISNLFKNREEMIVAYLKKEAENYNFKAFEEQLNEFEAKPKDITERKLNSLHDGITNWYNVLRKKSSKIMFSNFDKPIAGFFNLKEKTHKLFERIEILRKNLESQKNNEIQEENKGVEELPAGHPGAEDKQEMLPQNVLNENQKENMIVEELSEPISEPMPAVEEKILGANEEKNELVDQPSELISQPIHPDSDKDDAIWYEILAQIEDETKLKKLEDATQNWLEQQKKILEKNINGYHPIYNVLLNALEATPKNFWTVSMRVQCDTIKNSLQNESPLELASLIKPKELAELKSIVEVAIAQLKKNKKACSQWKVLSDLLERYDSLPTLKGEIKKYTEQSAFITQVIKIIDINKEINEKIIHQSSDNLSIKALNELIQENNKNLASNAEFKAKNTHFPQINSNLETIEKTNAENINNLTNNWVANKIIFLEEMNDFIYKGDKDPSIFIMNLKKINLFLKELEQEFNLEPEFIKVIEGAAGLYQYYLSNMSDLIIIDVTNFTAEALTSLKEDIIKFNAGLSEINKESQSTNKRLQASLQLLVDKSEKLLKEIIELIEVNQKPFIELKPAGEEDKKSADEEDKKLIEQNPAGEEDKKSVGEEEKKLIEPKPAGEEEKKVEIPKQVSRPNYYFCLNLILGLALTAGALVLALSIAALVVFAATTAPVSLAVGGGVGAAVGTGTLAASLVTFFATKVATPSPPEKPVANNTHVKPSS